MGYFKDTMYYGPNCQDFSDRSPEAMLEQMSPRQETGNYRVGYRAGMARTGTPWKWNYYQTNGEARCAFKQLKEQGYQVINQYWNDREALWIG